jgi:2',3'-cyclic-nucleotide 2'-phosphodiesterase (5'-nucleotidase family)
LDVYPFVDDILEVQLTGKQIREVLQQSLSLERGFVQISGLTIRYDLSRLIGDRLVDVQYGGEDLQSEQLYSIAAPGFLAEGGDLYLTFKGSEVLNNHGKVSAALLEHFENVDLVTAPEKGRQVDRAKSPQ